MTLEAWKEYSTYGGVIVKRYNISCSNCICNIFWVENSLIKIVIFMYLVKKQKTQIKEKNYLIAATAIKIESLSKKQQLAYFSNKIKCMQLNLNLYPIL